MMKRKAIQWAVIAGSAVVCTPSAFAGGIELYEFGTSDVGLASAGSAARAEDASTLFKNPAGMSLLDRSEFQLGAQLLYGSIHFQSGGGTTTSGGDGGNPLEFVPGGGLFYAQKVTKDLSLGVGAFSYFGLGLKYDSDWVGRYLYQEGGLAGITFMPGVSYRPLDWLSLGAGLNAMYGVFSQQAAVNNLIQPDGQLKIDDEAWGFGANAGVLVEPIEGTRVGVTYLSPVDLDFSDVPSFKGLSPGMEGVLGAAGLLSNRMDLGITVPQSVMVSAYQDLSESWAVLADFGWQDWSDFGKVDVTVNSATPTSLTFDRNYKDTYHGAVGVRYRFLPDWAATLGFAYDSSAVSDGNRTVDFPVGEAYRIGAGVQWKAAEAIELGAAYEFLWMGDLPVDQERGPLSGRVTGEYEDSAIHFFALNLSWRF